MWKKLPPSSGSMEILLSLSSLIEALLRLGSGAEVLFFLFLLLPLENFLMKDILLLLFAHKNAVTFTIAN